MSYLGADRALYHPRKTAEKWLVRPTAEGGSMCAIPQNTPQGAGALRPLLIEIDHRQAEKVSLVPVSRYSVVLLLNPNPPLLSLSIPRCHRVSCLQTERESVS